jgi:PAS domain S-box-containing protein
MSWQNEPFTVLLLAVALGMTLLGAYVAWRKDAPGSKTAALFIFASAEWILCYALELSANTLAGKLFWNKTQYLGIVTAPTAWFAFVLQYTGREQWLSRKTMVFLGLTAAFVWVLVLTNSAHGLMWTSAEILPGYPFLELKKEFGIGFWAMFSYIYVLLIMSAAFLAETFIRSSHLYKWQAALLLLGTFIPGMGRILTITRLNPYSFLDIEILGLSICGLILAWCVFRLHLIDIIPIAREAVIENMNDAIILLDRHGVVIDINPAGQRLIGRTDSEIIGHSFEAAWPGTISLKDCPGNTEVVFEMDGAQRTCDMRLSPLMDWRGRPAATILLLRDVTARKRAEEALRAKEKRHSAILDAIPDLVYELDLDGTINWANRHALESLGYSADRFMRIKLNELLDQEGLETAFRVIGDLLEGKHPQPEIYQVKASDGRVIPVEAQVTLLGGDGQPRTVLGVARDITERIRTERQLRASEEKYRTLLENIEDGFYEVDLSGNFVLFNGVICKVLGYSKDEIIGMNYRTYVDGENARRLFQAFNAVFTTGQHNKGFMCEVTTRDGAKKPVEYSISLVRDEQGTPIGFRGIVRDISERRRAEELLRASEEKYRTLFEESRDVVFMSTPQGRFLDINPAGVELFGYSSKEEMLKIDIAGDLFLNPLERESYRRLIERQRYVKDYEMSLKRKDGRPVSVLVTANAVCGQNGEISAYRGFIRDITERKQLEQQLFQAQKMESIGTLAGGIAHDFNNLLGGILGYASFLKSKLSDGDPHFKYVDTIERSAMRAAELTSQLLGFARGGKYDAKPVNMNKVIEETLKIIGRTLDKSIEITTHLCEELPTVEADAAQMQQVLMNLFVNAGDAMPHGGKLIVETSTSVLGEDYVRTHLGSKPGKYVIVSVTDTGIGMDRETVKRIFEPFFTTKEKGKGTGLGLAMVYGAVKNHGGSIRVYSEPGAGTTFKVYLPAHGAPEHVEAPVTAVARGGEERVLVVDDEETIRSLVKDTLESYGYCVLVAENGEEAVRIYREMGERIDLVILDMVMPKMGGRETFQRLKELNPKVKALLSTGYSQNGKAQEILDSGVLGFLQKPYQTHDLLAKLRSVLDARGRSE